MRTNARPTIVMVTPPSRRAQADLAAEDFTIRSIFSAKFSAVVAAERDSAVEFSRRFSAAAQGSIAKDGSVEAICVTRGMAKPEFAAVRKAIFMSSFM